MVDKESDLGILSEHDITSMDVCGLSNRNAFSALLWVIGGGF